MYGGHVPRLPLLGRVPLGLRMENRGRSSLCTLRSALTVGGLERLPICYYIFSGSAQLA